MPVNPLPTISEPLVPSTVRRFLSNHFHCFVDRLQPDCIVLLCGRQAILAGAMPEVKPEIDFTWSHIDVAFGSVWRGMTNPTSS